MMRKQTKIFILAIIIANALFFLLILLEYIDDHSVHHDPNAMSIDITQHSDLLFPQLSYWENFYAILWLILIGLGSFLYWHSIESRKPDIHYFKTNVIMKHTGFEDPKPKPKPLYNIDSYLYWGITAVLMIIVLMIIFILIMFLFSSYP